VEHERIEPVQVNVGATASALAQIGLVALVQGVQVTLDGQFTVHHWVLGRQVGLEEIVRVVHVRASESPLDHQRSVRSYQHRDCTGAARRSRVAFGIDSDISRNDHSQPTVPRARLHPRQRVEQGRRPTVTGVRRVDTLDLEIATGLKQFHQNCFHAFRLIDYGLGAHLQATYVRIANTVVFYKLTDCRQAQRVHVFEVCAKTHLLLSQTNGVFSCGHLIVLFQISLIDIQRWYDKMNSAYSNIFWPMIHDKKKSFGILIYLLIKTKQNKNKL